MVQLGYATAQKGVAAAQQGVTTAQDGVTTVQKAINFHSGQSIDTKRSTTERETSESKLEKAKVELEKAKVELEKTKVELEKAEAKLEKAEVKQEKVKAERKIETGTGCSDYTIHLLLRGSRVSPEHNLVEGLSRAQSLYFSRLLLDYFSTTSQPLLNDFSTAFQPLLKLLLISTGPRKRKWADLVDSALPPVCWQEQSKAERTQSSNTVYKGRDYPLRITYWATFGKDACELKLPAVHLDVAEFESPQPKDLLRNRTYGPL
jgi:hypothetical protein